MLQKRHASFCLYGSFGLPCDETVRVSPAGSLIFCCIVRVYACRFVSHTLLAAQEEETRVAPAFDAAMDFLLKKSFIVGSGGSAGRGGEESNSVVLSHTQLGKVCGISTKIAVRRL